MQRGERNQRLELRHHTGIDAHRTGEIGSAVHHPMPDSDEAVMRQLGAQEREQVIEGPIVAEIHALGPGLLRLRSLMLLGAETRRGVDRFVLPAKIELELLALLDEERELDAGRSCVDDDDRVGNTDSSGYRFLW